MSSILSHSLIIRFPMYYSLLGYSTEIYNSEVAALESQSKRNTSATKEAGKIELIKSHSRLLPQLLKIFEDTGVAYKKWLESPERGESPPSFLENQNLELDRKLQKCDKVAIIVPDYICRQVASRPRNNDMLIEKETLLARVFHCIRLGWLHSSLYFLED